jgi:hypothetical protein
VSAEKDRAQTTLVWAAALADYANTTLIKAFYYLMVAFRRRHRAAGDETAPQRTQRSERSASLNEPSCTAKGGHPMRGNRTEEIEF